MQYMRTRNPDEFHGDCIYSLFNSASASKGKISPAPSAEQQSARKGNNDSNETPRFPFPVTSFLRH